MILGCTEQKEEAPTAPTPTPAPVTKPPAPRQRQFSPPNLPDASGAVVETQAPAVALTIASVGTLASSLKGNKNKKIALDDAQSQIGAHRDGLDNEDMKTYIGVEKYDSPEIKQVKEADHAPVVLRSVIKTKPLEPPLSPGKPPRTGGPLTEPPAAPPTKPPPHPRHPSTSRNPSPVHPTSRLPGQRPSSSWIFRARGDPPAPKPPAPLPGGGGGGGAASDSKSGSTEPSPAPPRAHENEISVSTSTLNLSGS